MPHDKEEIVQQAIHDYHSPSDEYERGYVIERRRASVKLDKELETAKTSALEAKLLKTGVTAKITDISPTISNLSPPHAASTNNRRSLSNLTNRVLSPTTANASAGFKSPPPAHKLAAMAEEQPPSAKFPRLSGEALINRNTNE